MGVVGRRVEPLKGVKRREAQGADEEWVHVSDEDGRPNDHADKEALDEACTRYAGQLCSLESVKQRHHPALAQEEEISKF